MTDITERLEAAETTPIHQLPALCCEAAAEIKMLRCEVAAMRVVTGMVEVSAGSAFLDIKQEIKHGSPT